ncbi:MAG: VWA domain-containing protein [Candidatus Acidiferrales bacterium]
MAGPPQCSFARRVSCRTLFLLLILLPCVNLPAQSPTGQESPPKSEPAQAAPAQKPPTNQSAEVSSYDKPATFKVRVNLVLVRVVVRDAPGNVVGNLRKEDFQLFDNGKPQVISAFSVETLQSHAALPVTQTSEGEPEGSAEAAAKITAGLPQRFVSILFDDEHLAMQDSVFVRTAATRLFGALAASDRVGVYTTSGQVTQEFTDNRELISKALLGIVPRASIGSPEHGCPEIGYYQADLIEVRQDTQALGVATEDAIQCAFNGNRTMISQAQALAESAAANVLAAGDSQTEMTYRRFEEAIRRLSGMPGQRVMIFVSPGFIFSTLTVGPTDIIDRATRANIVINTMDARGLYTPDVLGDIADPPQDSPRTVGYKASYRVVSQSVQSQVLGELADGTGGTYFHNRNDLDEGFRQAGAAPAISYLLAFSPQNLKLDGRFHVLKVSLTNKLKYSVQARRGYYAPRTAADPVETAKREIEEALFSQDEIRDLPVELHTQFFKKDEAEARVAVVTHLDLRGIHFRKAEGRNHDDLTLATAIFDENGKYVTGGEKIVEMRLLDTTVDRLGRSGITVKSSFDVKPGTYLVRQVVRDSEGAQMAAKNGAVVIPY